MYDDKNSINIFYFSVVFNNLKLCKKNFNSFLNNDCLTLNGWSHGI